MIAKYYEMQELLDLLQAERQRRRWRYRCFVWFLGLTYIGFGLLAWQQLAGTWPPYRQVGGFLIAVVLWPFLLAIFSGCNRLLGQWPRCPECCGKLANFTPGSRRCPECHRIIVSDPRPPSKGYLLPELPPLVPRRLDPSKTSLGGGATQLIFMGLVFVPAMILIIPLGDRQNLTILELTAWSLVIIGCYVIIISNFMELLFAPLAKLAVWIDQKCQKAKPGSDTAAANTDKRKCPECDREPDHRIAAITGRCSLCGVRLIELAGTPDTPEMMDWTLVHRYAKLTGLGVQYYIFVLFPLSFVFLATNHIWQKHWWFWLITAIFFAVIPLFWSLVLLSYLRHRWRLNFKCPVCTYKNGPSNEPASWQIFQQFGHCVNCKSKLVSDDDPAADKVQ